MGADAVNLNDAVLAQTSEVLQSSTQAVVVFPHAADARRALVAGTAAWECVLGPGLNDIDAIVGVVDRLIAGRARNEALDAQATQLRALIDGSSDGIYIIRNGRFAWTNRRFQQMVGYTDDELTAPGFSMMDELTAPASRLFVAERLRRLQAGLPVEPRYEFTARRRSGEQFDAYVSVSYVDRGDGRSEAIGIIQDITERKSVEALLVQKNREMQQLNALSAAVNRTLSVDELLHLGCTHIAKVVPGGAAGISLLSSDRRVLGLRVSERLDDAVAREFAKLPADSPSLLARVVRSGTLSFIDDLTVDPGLPVGVLRDAHYSGSIVVPLQRRGSGEHNDVVGVAFCFVPAGRQVTESDRDVMIAIGHVLDAAIEQAALLEAEQSANRKLVALDEIALSLASTLDPDAIALIVARSMWRLFGAMRVMITRLNEDHTFFSPVHVLDDGEPALSPVPIPLSDTIMGVAAKELRPVQRVRPRGNDAVIDPSTGDAIDLHPYERSMFQQGVGCALAVPVVIDGVVTGALWLGYLSSSALPEIDLQLLSAIGTHVGIASKNAAVLEARERALEELRAAQQKLVENEKVSAIGLIAHGVAHDFNNILGSILGRSQLLRSQLTEPALARHVDIIEKAATDGAETVRRIQELGRQDRVDDFIAIDTSSILQDVIDLTISRVGQKPGVRIDAAADDEARVAGNPAELREVLINLVHNAVDAMPADGGSVHLRAMRNGDTVYITVRDSGRGIPEDVLHRIFDPYFTTKGERGTGLGLSVSQSIVRRHGGQLRVSSQTHGPERGTTFTIELPAWNAPQDALSTTMTAPTEDAGQESVPTRARVLVVDDEENIREILADVLSTADHTVITAADGAEGLHKLKNDPTIDLVFTDLGLPGMSGYEVAQEMKRLRPDLVVGLVTGWGATLDAEAARVHGVDLVVSKPFRFEQVLSIVHQAVVNRRGPR
jgi:PAS domain S-box-containing protein